MRLACALTGSAQGGAGRVPAPRCCTPQRQIRGRWRRLHNTTAVHARRRPVCASTTPAPSAPPGSPPPPRTWCRAPNAPRPDVPPPPSHRETLAWPALARVRPPPPHCRHRACVVPPPPVSSSSSSSLPRVQFQTHARARCSPPEQFDCSPHVTRVHVVAQQKRHPAPVQSLRLRVAGGAQANASTWQRQKESTWRLVHRASSPHPPLPKPTAAVAAPCPHRQPSPPASRLGFKV